MQVMGMSVTELKGLIRNALRETRRRPGEDVEILPGLPTVRVTKVWFERPHRIPWQWCYYYGDRGGWNWQACAVSGIFWMIKEKDHAERADRS